MYIKNIILLLILFSLVACQKAENKMLNSDSPKMSESKVNSGLLINEYKQIKLPFDSKTLLINDKFIQLDKYSLNQKDLKLFYSGKDQARILMTTVEKLGSKEYLLGLIAVNFNNYEGSGPAQVIFLSGGENNKNNYKNTLFITMGGKFPILDHQAKRFNDINESKLKNYCIQSFVINNDLSKNEEMKCVGNEPSIEKKNFRLNITRFGYDDISFNGFSTVDGGAGESKSHINGEAGDIRYLRTDKKALAVILQDALYDHERSLALVNNFILFGWG